MSTAEDDNPRPRVAVIGAGVAGIAHAVKMREAGIDFIVLEKAGEIGGTWRDNRYPGLTCDVPVIGYCYSFDPQGASDMLLATAPELQDILERRSSTGTTCVGRSA